VPARLLVAGDLGLDVVVRPQGPVRQGDDVPAQVHLRPGGQGANVAVWARCTGVPVHLYTQVGADRWSGWLQKEVRRRGVVVHARQTASSTRVVSVSQGEERTLYSHGGDGPWAELPAGNVPRGSWLYVSGYVWAREGGREWLSRAHAWRRHQKVALAVTPGALSALGPSPWAAWRCLAEGADVVLLSAREAQALTGQAQARGAAEALATHYPVVLVTDGAQGAVLAVDGGLHQVPAPPPAQGVVDPTGAGDAAAGTFLGALVQGEKPLAAAQAAMTWASQAVSRIGAWP
jgi:sugar/nucleoside kinase (ribokinase family)